VSFEPCLAVVNEQDGTERIEMLPHGAPRAVRVWSWGGGGDASSEGLFGKKAEEEMEEEGEAGEVRETHCLVGHSAVVGMVKMDPRYPGVVYTVGDDGLFVAWDLHGRHLPPPLEQAREAARVATESALAANSQGTVEVARSGDSGGAARMEDGMEAGTGDLESKEEREDTLVESKEEWEDTLVECKEEREDTLVESKAEREDTLVESKEEEGV